MALIQAVPIAAFECSSQPPTPECCDDRAHSRDGDQVFQAMMITDSSDRDQVRWRTRLTGLSVLEMASWSRLAIVREVLTFFLFASMTP
ncbi:hypothetical protein GGD65_008196 [Bradyrhizobium sp. CIR18]|uniref:hypothetical protein n=1 Tax=Bradyrhizobium sp. CIR18 TaxID=2663839 RepID=UPI001606482B|nr:hypothetical protein [Bradyrhizobium sp. CIR18]MBB4367120.1 hypothetical protein [Bradyrhizobium sp. CIR18]